MLNTGPSTSQQRVIESLRDCDSIVGYVLFGCMSCSSIL